MLHLITPNLSRRRFLLQSGATAAITAWCRPGVSEENKGLQQRLAEDPMRPQFHLMPAAGWMNDPNGPIFAHGRYHMFCQHNPRAAVWGNMSWAHMVSEDMIHWHHLPLALKPDPGGMDSYGVFSGSCFSVGRRVYAVYTATEISDAAHATTHGRPDIRESQRLAYSDDPMLLHWTKQPSAIVPAPPASLQGVTGFRDPSIWRQDGAYYMTVGSGETGKGGCVLLYRSPDLKQWSYLHKLAQSDWHGSIGEDKVGSGEMWECPDFFALDGGHVLIYSTEGKVYWQSGKLDTTSMRFRPSRQGVLDMGAYYAPKTQTDASGNRILWGWIPERRPEAVAAAAGWAGVMSLPRVLHLESDGSLSFDVSPALQQLRGARSSTFASDLSRSLTLSRANGEVLLTGIEHTPLLCVVRDKSTGTETARVVCDPSRHLVEADASFSAQVVGATPLLHLFADGSVLEFILNQRVGYTKRFYLSDAPDLEIEVQGAREATAWEIQPISTNRLTSLT